MRESIGGISLMSIFIFFFIMVTFFLTGTILYYRGYKVNSQIANSLEKFEGYNRYSAADIDRVLSNLGYRQVSSSSCGKASDGSDIECLENNGNYKFSLKCSRTKKNDNKQYTGENYYIKYQITTYIYIDLPLNLSIKIPVTSKTNPIYQFSGYENGLGC